MKHKLMVAALVVMAALFTACTAPVNDGDIVTLDPNEDGGYICEPAPGETPAVMPARPGSGATGDPSADLPELAEISGIVKEVNQDLVLIESADEGEYMLRFTGDTIWAKGINTKIKRGNTVSCTVMPEPTLTTPAQGQVYEVFENKVP